MAVFGVALAAFLASSAMAIPAPLLSGGKSNGNISGGFAGNQGTGLLLGGSNGFGAGLTTSQQASMSISSGSGAIMQTDNYRRRGHHRGGFIQPSDAPEPAAIWLLGAGLATMVFFARRKRQTL